VNPSTFTEMCIREIYEEKCLGQPAEARDDGEDVNTNFVKTNMLDRSLIG